MLKQEQERGSETQDLILRGGGGTGRQGPEKWAGLFA